MFRMQHFPKQSDAGSLSDAVLAGSEMIIPDTNIFFDLTRVRIGGRSSLDARTARYIEKNIGRVYMLDWVETEFRDECAKRDDCGNMLWGFNDLYNKCITNKKYGSYKKYERGDGFDEGSDGYRECEKLLKEYLDSISRDKRKEDEWLWRKTMYFMSRYDRLEPQHRIALDRCAHQLDKYLVRADASIGEKYAMFSSIYSNASKMRSCILKDEVSRNAMRDWVRAEIRNDMKIVIHCILLARLAPHEKMVLLSNDYDVHTVLREGARQMDQGNLRILDVQKFKNAV